MPDATTSIAPIVKTVTVGVSPEAAYRLFTDGWENSDAGQARRDNYD